MYTRRVTERGTFSAIHPVTQLGSTRLRIGRGRRWAGALALPAILASVTAASPEVSAEPIPAAPAGCQQLAVVLQKFVDARGGLGRSAALDRRLSHLSGALTAECRRSLSSVGWPGLGELLDGAEASVTDRQALCLLAPLDALPRLLKMFATPGKLFPCDVSGGCAATLLQTYPDQAAPLLMQSVLALQPREGGWRVPCESVEMARQLPGDRDRLAPLLEEATRMKARGRDELRAELCSLAEAPPAPASAREALCAAASSMEPSWQTSRHRRSALATALPALALQMIYAAVILVLRRKLALPGFPAGALVAFGAAMAALGLSGLVVLGQASGPLAGVPVWVFLVTSPIVVASGALAGLASVRWLQLSPVVVCLVADAVAIAATIKVCFDIS